MYVIEKDIQNNLLVVEQKEDLKKTVMYVEYINWISGFSPKESFHAQVKIRYSSPDYNAFVEPQNVPLILLCPTRQRYGAGVSTIRRPARTALICISMVHPKLRSDISNSQRD